MPSEPAASRSFMLVGKLDSPAIFAASLIASIFSSVRMPMSGPEPFRVNVSRRMNESLSVKGVTKVIF